MERKKEIVRYKERESVRKEREREKEWKETERKSEKRERKKEREKINLFMWRNPNHVQFLHFKSNSSSFKGESKENVKEKEKVGEEMKNWAFLMFQFRLFSAIEVVINIWITV